MGAVQDWSSDPFSQNWRKMKKTRKGKRKGRNEWGPNGVRRKGADDQHQLTQATTHHTTPHTPHHQSNIDTVMQASSDGFRPVSSS